MFLDELEAIERGMNHGAKSKVKRLSMLRDMSPEDAEHVHGERPAWYEVEYRRVFGGPPPRSPKHRKRK